MTSSKAVGLRLLNLRQQTGKTQAEIAKLIGVSRSAYVKYELGAVKPSQQLNKLADLFGVTTDYIMCRTDNPHETLQIEQPLAKVLSGGDTRMEAILSTLGDAGQYRINGSWYKIDGLTLATLKNTIAVFFKNGGDKL